MSIGSEKFLIGGHAAAALFARHAVAEAGDDRKLEVFAARTVEDDAVGVDEAEFGAVAEKRDRRALGDFDANAIRQNALDVSGIDPAQLFERAAARVERDADDAVTAIADELLQNGIAADDVIAGEFDLLGLEQRDLRRVIQKIAGKRGCGDQSRWQLLRIQMRGDRTTRSCRQISCGESRPASAGAR